MEPAWMVTALAIGGRLRWGFGEKPQIRSRWPNRFCSILPPQWWRDGPKVWVPGHPPMDRLGDLDSGIVDPLCESWLLAAAALGRAEGRQRRLGRPNGRSARVHRGGSRRRRRRTLSAPVP